MAAEVFTALHIWLGLDGLIRLLICLISGLQFLGDRRCDCLDELVCEFFLMHHADIVCLIFGRVHRRQTFIEKLSQGFLLRKCFGLGLSSDVHFFLFAVRLHHDRSLGDWAAHRRAIDISLCY